MKRDTFVDRWQQGGKIIDNSCDKKYYPKHEKSLLERLETASDTFTSDDLDMLIRVTQHSEATNTKTIHYRACLVRSNRPALPNKSSK